MRPRPGFGTFLHSDANVTGDGLSFHDYKRLLRANKVKLLQEKRAASYVPGYKKTEATNAQIIKKPVPVRTTNAAAQTTNTQGIVQSTVVSNLIQNTSNTTGANFVIVFFLMCDVLLKFLICS